MLRRIALFLLMLLAAACAEAKLDDDPGAIGTSPSSPPRALAAPAPALVEASVEPLPCGIWVDASVAEADARALAGEPPDALVFTLGHTSCSDAIASVNEKWPGHAVVRYAVDGWRAAHPP